MKCIVCGNNMHSSAARWSVHCDQCGYWRNNKKVSQSDIVMGNYNNSDAKNIANLDPIRLENFKKIIGTLKKYNPALKSILDVGCATGLFINVAKDYGYNCTGIEPNKIMSDKAQMICSSVLNGFFPDMLVDSQKFDIIIFNDVFEHIDNLDTILDGCFKHLRPDGVLLINIPSSRGLLFRLARLLATFKLFGPWNRLWQNMFYTPHIHYFDPRCLNMFLCKHSFTPISESTDLPVFSINKLWERVIADKSTNAILNACYFLGLLLLSFALRFFPSDSFFVMYSKQHVSLPKR